MFMILRIVYDLHGLLNYRVYFWDTCVWMCKDDSVRFLNIGTTLKNLWDMYLKKAQCTRCYIY